MQDPCVSYHMHTPTNPLVSIITPSYNQAKFLEQTIRSVLAQDYQPIEFIIIDGASTDGSLEIIRRFEDRLIFWISEPDQGQADAINKGFNQARGDIVAWLNSDDLYLPGAVSQAVDALQTEPELGMVFGDALTIDTQGRPLNLLAFGDWGLVELMSFRIICQSAVFIRRAVLDQTGSLDPNYHILLDHHLWIRIAKTAPIRHVATGSKSVGRTSDDQSFSLWAAARHHPGAKNVNQASKFGEEALRLLAWMEEQPDLVPLVKRYKKQIYAGAYRLNGRYLLDGGQPKAALKSYWRAFTNKPGFTLKHKHRILYATTSLIGADGLVDRHYRIPSERKSLPIKSHELEGWPGLDINKTSGKQRA